MNKEKERFNELRFELEQCREEKRHTQGNLLSVATAATTALSIITGATYITRETLMEQGNLADILGVQGFLAYFFQHLYIGRIILALSCFVLIVAFSYGVKIGIDNLLLFYYERNILERITDLTYDNSETHYSDDEKRGKFLYYGEFSSPIITLNRRHIVSSHAFLHFVVYILAIVSVSAFAIGLVILQYMFISIRGHIDTIMVGGTIVYIAVVFVLYLRMNAHGQTVFQSTIDVAHQNQELRRENKKTYVLSEDFWDTLRYLLFPRLGECYKWVFILYGAVLTLFFGNTSFDLYGLFWVWFYYEMLIYGIRYQINDIRGWREDIQIKKKRLLKAKRISEPEYLKRNIRHSLEVIIIRLVFATFTFIYLGVYDSRLVIPILCCTVVQIVLFVLYEYSRKKGKDILVYILVGMGYPLRIMIGYLSQSDITSLFDFNYCALWMILFAMFLFGSFASIMFWKKEVEFLEEMDVKLIKPHYFDIKKRMKTKRKVKLWDVLFVATIVILVIGMVHCLIFGQNSLLINFIALVGVVSITYIYLKYSWGNRIWKVIKSLLQKLFLAIIGEENVRILKGEDPSKKIN